MDFIWAATWFFWIAAAVFFFRRGFRINFKEACGNKVFLDKLRRELSHLPGCLPAVFRKNELRL